MADNQAMTYMAKIGVDGSEFTGGLEKMAQGFTAMFGPTGIAVGAIAVTTSAIAGLIIEQGKIAAANLDMADTTGIAVEEIQRFHYAAKITGEEIGTVDAMLNTLTLSMGEARDATSAQALAFKEMGIDPTGKSTEEVFLAMANSLTTMSDKQKMSSLAADILGKSYKDSLPFMIDYLEKQKEISEQEVFSKEQEESLERGARAFEKIGAKAEGFAGWVAIGLVEGAEELAFLLQNGQSSIMAGRAKGVDDYGSGATNTWSPEKIKTGIIDPFAGWTQAEVELQLQTDKVTEAQKELQLAMAAEPTKENVAKVRELSAAYSEERAILKDLIALKTEEAVLSGVPGATYASADKKGKANTFIGYDSSGKPMYSPNAFYDSGAIENQGISTAEDRAAAMAGVNYGSGANTGYYEGEYAANTSRYQANLAFAMSDTTGNASLAAIKSLDASRYRLNNVDNPNYGAGTGTYASMSDQYMAAYRQSQNPTVIIQVSPDFSESAQSIAEKTAEAMSRELARQASGT